MFSIRPEPLPPEPDSGSQKNWRVGHRGIAAVAALMFLFGMTLTAVRIVTRYQTPGPFTPDRQGLCDFHNGIYFPVRAILAGDSPYSETYAAEYPVARQIPFFSPVILALHAPLAVLPLHVGEFLNWILQLGCLIGIAALSAHAAGYPKRIDAILVVMACLVFTRGGHITFFNGYFTFQLILATFLSLIWADRRPVAAAWMLMIVSAKPTYILPLGFLMLARGNYRALVIGAVLSIVAATVLMGFVASGQGDTLGAGITELGRQIVQTQEVHRSMDDESPVHSWTRLDLFAVISKWRGTDPGELPHLLIMFVILAPPMWVLWRRKRLGIDDGLAGLTGAIVLIGMLVSLYHQSYDSLLLAAPICGAVACRLNSWQTMPRLARWSVVAMMVAPAINYLSTRTFLQRFEPPPWVTGLFTSLNGVSLAAALVIVCYFAWRQSRNGDFRSSRARSTGD